MITCTQIFIFKSFLSRYELRDYTFKSFRINWDSIYSYDYNIYEGN